MLVSVLADSFYCFVLKNIWIVLVILPELNCYPMPIASEYYSVNVKLLMQLFWMFSLSLFDMDWLMG
jgi:hypothetical protein